MGIKALMNINVEQEEKFKTRDAGSYDAVSDTFDRLSEQYIGPIAERLISLASLKVSEKVLDIGTGTGMVAFRTAHHVGKSGKVVGIDLSNGMLTKGREKAATSRTNGHVKFQKMDAEALTFDDGTFDSVLSLFALRHFPNPQMALQEMFRVLCPGGRVVIAVGSGPPLFSVDGVVAGWRRVSEHLKEHLGLQLMACKFLNELVEKLLPEIDGREEAQWTKDHTHLTESVPALVKSAGFGNVRSSWMGQHTEIKTAEEFWEVQVTFSSLARKRISAAPPAKVEMVKEKFMEGCQRVLGKGGKLLYPTGALFVTASHP